jgi:hypothetical protein
MTRHKGIGGHQYEIVNASKRMVKELWVENRKVELDKQGHAYVYDEGLAKEIDTRYGVKAKTPQAGKVVVCPVSDRDPTREPGHMYTFFVPDLSRFKGWTESRNRFRRP